MKNTSIEDPAETLPEGTRQLSPGNPLGLSLNEVVVLTASILRADGSTLRAGTEVVIREITPMPSIYLATIEPMGVTGTTSEYLCVQLPLLERIDPPEYLIPGCTSMPIANELASTEKAKHIEEAIKAAMRLSPDEASMGAVELNDPSHE